MTKHTNTGNQATGNQATEGEPRAAKRGSSPAVRNVLYFDHTARMGGGEIALLNLVSALSERYYPIVVLASEGPLVDKLRMAGVETWIAPLDETVLETRKDSLGVGSLLRLRQAVACVRYAFTLARLARRLRADLIHTNSLKADLIGGMAGRLAGIPVLWHVRDNIDGHYLPPAVAAAFRLLSRVIPQAVVANSQSTLRTLRPARRQTTATVYSGVASGALAEEWEADGRLQVVHDGYDPHSFGADLGADQAGDGDAPPVTTGTQVAVLVGRIAGWKGQHVFIRAAALIRADFPQARFLIVGAPLFGEHDYERSLHALAEELEVTDCVEFLGFRDDVPAILAEADVVVHASILGEPFGQVIIEGMAAGKPVIATEGGALPEIVVPGETGLLVPMGDAPAMAEAMAQMLGEPVRAAQMGQAGRRRVQDRFTIARTVHKMEKVYDYLLDPRTPVSRGAGGVW